MRYIVTGARADNGHDTTTTIEADTPAEAEQQARGVGLVVSRVALAVDYRKPDTLDNPTPSFAGMVPITDQYFALEKFRPTVAITDWRVVPEYPELLKAAKQLRDVGGYAFFLAIAYAATGFLPLFAVIDSGGSGEEAFDLLWRSLVWGFWCIVVSTILRALSAAAVAFRDLCVCQRIAVQAPVPKDAQMAAAYNPPVKLLPRHAWSRKDFIIAGAVCGGIGLLMLLAHLYHN